MTKFRCKIANHVVGISTIYESTKNYCSAYLTDEPYKINIEITQGDLDLERVIAAKEDVQEGIQPRNLSDAYLERTAVQRKIKEVLIDHNVLLFHGSVVAVDGQAYLFTAKSGTGKSTHTSLWRRVFADRAIMVNDDKPFLEIREDAVIAHGSPWNGKHGLGENISLPLRAICILERGERNEIQRIASKDAILMLLQQSARPINAGRLFAYMGLIDALANNLDFYRLKCNMDSEAAVVAYEAMSGQKYEGEWK